MDLEMQKVGVQKSKEVLMDVANMAAIITDMIKNGIDATAFFKFTGLFSHLLELMQDAPASWPELKDLDEAEAAELGATAYKAAKLIYEAVKQPKK